MVDLSAVANPYLAIIIIGVGIGAFAFGADYQASADYDAEIISLHSRIQENKIVSEYMGTKMKLLIEGVERSPNVREAGILLRKANTEYRIELLERYDIPKIQRDMQQAVEKMKRDSLLVPAGQALSVLMIIGGLFFWIKRYNAEPPVTPMG